MATVARAEIEVTADTKPFLPALKRQMGKAQKSATAIGQRIGAKLGESMSKAAEQGTSRMGLALGGIVAVLPLITSGLSVLAGGATALTGSLLRAASSALSAVGVMGSLFQAALVGKLAFGGLSDAIGGSAEAMAKLSPAGKALAETVKGLGPAWQDFRNAIQQTALQGLAPMVQGIADKFLGPGSVQSALKGTGTQLNLLFKDIGKFVQSESFVKRFSGALRGNNQIFASLRKAAVPLLNGLLNLYRALQPAAGRLAEKIASVAQAFSGWTKGEGFAKRIDGFMIKAQKSAALLWRFIKNLGIALWNVTQIGAGAGDGLIKTFGDLAIKFRAFTESTEGKNKIAEWINTSVAALRTFGRIISTLGGVLGALFNPQIMASFLSVIETLTPVISKVAGVIQGALQPVIESIGEALAENGPKIAALFVAIGPLLKAVGVIIGEVISQALGIIGTLAAILTPVIGLISKYLAPILIKLAPIIAALILGFGNLGFRLIGLFKYLGPVGKLFAKLIGPIVRLGGAIFSLIGKAIRPLAAVVGFVFKFIFKIISSTVKILGTILKVGFNAYKTVITVVLKAIWSVIKVVWRAISFVVRGAVKVIGTVVRTYFNIVRTVVTTVMRAVLAVIRTVWNAIRGVVLGTVRAIGSTISKVWNTVRSVTSNVWNGIKSVVTKVVGSIKSAISSGFSQIVSFVKGLPSRVLALGASFLSAGKELGGKIITGMAEGLRNIINGIGDFGTLVKDKINSALGLPKKISGPGPIPDFTIPGFYRGTNFAPGGAAWVGEKGPELVTLPRGSKVTPAGESRRAADAARNGGGGFPKKVILRIGSRDFEAYVTALADDRIEVSDALAYQGA